MRMFRVLANIKLCLRQNVKYLRMLGGLLVKIAGRVTETSSVYSLCLLAARSADADQSEAFLKNGAILIGLEIECEPE